MKKARIKSRKKRLFWIFSFFCVFSLLSLYVFQVKGMTENSFRLAGCRDQLEELSEETEGMESAFLKNKSLKTAVELARNSDFEKVDRVSYIEVAKSSMVSK